MRILMKEESKLYPKRRRINKETMSFFLIAFVAIFLLTLVTIAFQCDLDNAITHAEQFTMLLTKSQVLIEYPVHLIEYLAFYNYKLISINDLKFIISVT